MRLLKHPTYPRSDLFFAEQEPNGSQKGLLDWVPQPNGWSQDFEGLLRVFHYPESTDTLKWSVLVSVLAQVVHIYSHLLRAYKIVPSVSTVPHTNV